ENQFFATWLKSSMRPIYLDYNATTPVDPAVFQAMLPYLGDAGDGLGNFGNPSSTHLYGKEAHTAVEKARQEIAELMGAQPDEIVFTSGGTEASNLALKGIVFAKLGRWFGRWARDAHIITSSIEHPATVKPCEFLKRLGCSITIVPVDG